MTIADDRILEYLADHESGTPSEMAKVDTMRFSRSYLHQRCDVLEEYGLVRHLGNGVHILTDKGSQYLNGGLDTGKLDGED
jgi:DNA-binding IclR family transcriptional regulator